LLGQLGLHLGLRVAGLFQGFLEGRLVGKAALEHFQQGVHLRGRGHDVKGLGLELQELLADEVGGDEFFHLGFLLFANGSEIKVGAPNVSDATVQLEILQHDRDDKIIVFKRKRRKRYRLTKGHRQHFTEVLVREITCGPDTSKVEETTVQRARVRARALEQQKVQIKKPTRREKVAAQALQTTAQPAKV